MEHIIKKGLNEKNENDGKNDREYEKKIQKYREMKVNKKWEKIKLGMIR